MIFELSWPLLPRAVTQENPGRVAVSHVGYALYVIFTYLALLIDGVSFDYIRNRTASSPFNGFTFDAITAKSSIWRNESDRSERIAVDHVCRGNHL